MINQNVNRRIRIVYLVLLFLSFCTNQKVRVQQHNGIAKIMDTNMVLSLSLFDKNLIQLYECVLLATLLRVFFSGTPIVRIIV